jgi:hypothetical protein
MKQPTSLSFLAVALVLVASTAARADLAHRYSFASDASDSVGTADGVLVNNTGNASHANGILTLGNDGTLSHRSNDDNGDYVDLPNGMISSLGNQATFETWFTWDGGNNFQRIFDFGTSDGGEDASPSASGAKYVMLTPKANLTFYVHSDDGTQSILTTDTVSSSLVGVENHLVVSWDGANDIATVYCNGAAVGYQYGLKYSLTTLTDNNNWLGRAQWNDTMLAGAYNEFRIYNEALSPAQVYKNCHDGPDAAFTRVSTVAASLTSAPVHRYSFNGDCADSIGSADGVLVNNTTNAAFAGGKLTLGNDGSQRSNDGTGDYVDLPNGMISALEDNATFEFWVTSNSGDSTIWERIFDFGTSVGGEDVSDTGSGCSYIMATPASSGKQLEYGHRYGDTNDARYATAPDPLEAGEETHVVCVWDGDNDEMLLYVNGEFVAMHETLFDLEDLNDVNNWLGRAQYNDINFQGGYNEFRVYDYALTAGEVLGNYEAGADVVTAVPEPAVLTILAGVLLGLTAVRRRRLK